jgi:elongation factor Ts
MITASLVKELREKSGAGMLDCKKALEATNGNIDEAIDWLREKGLSKAAKKADRIAAEGIAAILESGNKAVCIEVNSETDFVAKNEEFTSMVDTILKAILDSDMEDVINGDINTVLSLSCSEGTINDLIISKTAKIGEKLSLRRFSKITKKDSDNFGSYIHMGGKIAVLTLIEGATKEVAKDVSMHAAAMRPVYVKKEDVEADTLERERAVLTEQAINEGKQPEIAKKMVEGRIRKYYEEVCLEEQPFVKDSDINVRTFVQNNGGRIINMVRYEVGEGMEKKNENFAEEVAKQMGN